MQEKRVNGCVMQINYALKFFFKKISAEKKYCQHPSVPFVGGWGGGGDVTFCANKLHNLTDSPGQEKKNVYSFLQI